MQKMMTQTNPKLLGRCPEDVSSNCGIDFFSIGHILFGFISYIALFSVFMFIVPNPVELSLFMTQNVGFLWEFLENYLLVNTKYKFQQKRDCLLNSLLDIVFVTCGGLGGLGIGFLPNPLIFALSVSFGLFASFKILEKRTMGHGGFIG